MECVSTNHKEEAGMQEQQQHQHSLFPVRSNVIEHILDGGPEGEKFELIVVYVCLCGVSGKQQVWCADNPDAWVLKPEIVTG